MTMRYVIFSLLFALVTNGTFAGEARQLSLRLLTLTQYGFHDEVLDATVQALEKRLPGYRLIVHHDSLDSQKRAAEVKDGELFIGTSGFFREVERHGFTSLGTLATPLAPNPNEAMAGAVIVRTDAVSINTLDDLKGKRAVTTRINAFMNAQMALGEIAARGYDPGDFFSKIDEIGRPMESVITAVAEGKADAGLVKAGVWEGMLANRHPAAENVRVLEPKTNDSMIYRHSSEAYPGWTLMASDTLSPVVLRDVTQALFMIPPEEIAGAKWLPATEFARVDKLFETLKYGPYDYLNHWTLERIWREFSMWIVLAAAAVLFSIFHFFRSEAVIRRKTAELASASERISSLEKISATGQLSNIVAHELLQPMAATGYYLATLEKLIGSGCTDTAKLLGLCSKMQNTARRSTAIVERVRQYARSRHYEPVRIECRSFILKTLEHLRQAHALKLEPVLTLDAAYVLADPVEMEIMVTNLIKNAAEAAVATGKRRFDISMTVSSSDVLLTFSNSTAPLKDADCDALTTPLRSSKNEGLGLGLAVVRSIVERAEGRFSIMYDGIDQIVAVVSLPAAAGAGELKTNPAEKNE